MFLFSVGLINSHYYHYLSPVDGFDISQNTRAMSLNFSCFICSILIQ